MSKVVLITGASTGFGRETAERLARRGHHVFAAMRDPRGRNAEHRAALERMAGAESVPIEVVEMDCCSDASVERAVERVLEAAGRVDVAVNNAGVAGLGVTEAYTPEQWSQMFDVNVNGAVRVNRAVLPSMRKQRSGLLIHISSGAGRVAVPAMGPYCATKFALEALADAYRYELTPFGIESVIVEPGIYRTPLFDRLMAPADSQRIADYGAAAEFADRVHGTFKGAIGVPENPGSVEVADALVRLIEASERPFRTVVSAPIQQLLEPYNAAAEALRPVVAQIFNVPELAGAGAPAMVS